jgi:unsaturated rhamnogalacturonyl hydrolase
MLLRVQTNGQLPITNQPDMILVKGGVFNMGSNQGKKDERPVHAVKLNDYMIGRYEVTQGLWQQVMGSLPEKCNDGPTHPVYNVTDETVALFLTKLNALTGKHYRLPSEAEWEYAARGGNQSQGFKYCGSNSLEDIAWYAPNSGMKTHPVGQKKPNELGLYDMSGNVWERCADWYKANYYKHTVDENPVQLKKQMFRLVRGGSWRSEEQRCQACARNLDVYDHHISNGGLRLVMELPESANHFYLDNSATFTWVDSMDNYARNVFLPARRYKWNWQHAALLNTLVHEYDAAAPEVKPIYLQYIQTAMDKVAHAANGKMPNSVASGLGMAFLYRITKEDKYKRICDKIYKQYLNSKHLKNGAVSHVPVFSETWDDTVFMIGEFLLAMYRATGDETYLDELAKQIALHRELLQVPEWGLWAHGYDQQGWGHCLFCSQIHWGDKQHKRSAEIWGRGNGWILVTLSDALQLIPQSKKHYQTFAGYLREMVVNLPRLQDPVTGHWRQLPVHTNDTANFIESSCTAMFAYGIQNALQLKVVEGTAYETSVKLAYKGLQEHSIVSAGGPYLNTANVCGATCIGTKEYYYHRPVKNGRAYALGAFVLFGRCYQAKELEKK